MGRTEEELGDLIDQLMAMAEGVELSERDALELLHACGCDPEVSLRLLEACAGDTRAALTLSQGCGEGGAELAIKLIAQCQGDVNAAIRQQHETNWISHRRQMQQESDTESDARAMTPLGFSQQWGTDVSQLLKVVRVETKASPQSPVVAQKPQRRRQRHRTAANMVPHRDAQASMLIQAAALRAYGARPAKLGERPNSTHTRVTSLPFPILSPQRSLSDWRGTASESPPVMYDPFLRREDHTDLGTLIAKHPGKEGAWRRKARGSPTPTKLAPLRSSSSPVADRRLPSRGYIR
eukprot:COSAG05_NODE_428_length_9890_cov_4.534470_3_plen_294_part_00